MVRAAKLEAAHAVEALLQVRLHGLGVLRLRQDLQQFLVGQEVEAGEPAALCFLQKKCF
jgi:hypothetical protein